jgi:hypothetical protein
MMKILFKVIVSVLLLFVFPAFGNSRCLAPRTQEIQTIEDKTGKTYVLKKVSGTIKGNEQVFLFAEQETPVPAMHDAPEEVIEWYYADDLKRNYLFKDAFQKGFSGNTAGYISYIIHNDGLFPTYEITHVDIHYLFRNQGIFKELLQKMCETWPPGTRLIINNIEHEETYDHLASRGNKPLKAAFRNTLFNTVLEQCGFKVERVTETYSKMSGMVYDVHAVFKPGEPPVFTFRSGLRILGSMMQMLRTSLISA